MGLFRGIGARKDATRGSTPIEVRKVLAGLFASNDTGIGARSGILYNGSSEPLGTGDATWAYNVGLFHAYVSRSASDGGTVYGNDGSVLIGATGVGSTVPIAPGAGLSRIDIAWTRHPTAGENGDGATTVALASEPLFGVASGVAASSSPVAPTIPAGAFELFRNLMTSAATSTLSAGNTITQSALYTAVRGAPVPVRNQAERDALPLFDGQRADRLDLHIVERYNGTTWNAGTPFAMAAGTIASTTAAGTAVVFPVGRFTVAPIVTLGPTWVSATGAVGNAASIKYLTLTAAGMTVQSDTATTIGCNWTAVQMTPTSADG